MRVAVVLNASSGRAIRRRLGPKVTGSQILELFKEAGVDAAVRLAEPQNVERETRRAVAEGFDVVVAAGGDGTVSTVAGVVAGTSAALGVLPLGTLNHFARDAGIPLQLEQAVGAIAAGRVRAVDVADVNGRRFVNNSSIGLYPHLVSRRNREQERLGSGKWRAMLAALASVFRRYPVVNVVLETPSDRVAQTTPLVFVGNNRYGLNGLMLGRRERLDEGILCVHFTRRTGRFGLVRLALRALLGRLEQARDFGSLEAPAVEIMTPKRTLAVSLDGELTHLVPPLRYRVHPGILRLLVP
jgi:diacylglycerol kinase family enzyme